MSVSSATVTLILFIVSRSVNVNGDDGQGVNDLMSSSSSLSSISSIRRIDAVCHPEHMDVTIVFDGVFNGVVYSKGFYHDSRCVHTSSSTSPSVVSFRLQRLECGTRVSAASAFDGQPDVDGNFVSNTIVVQFDPVVQEVFDQARRIKCNWFDYYEKDILFQPINVGQLNAITANFMGDDDLQCWMQIQVGKGPWAPEVDGIVRIGQTLTLVIGIKDSEDKFDLTIRDCIAHDGNGYNSITPIRLVDERGCVTRPKLMTQFQKREASTSFATAVAFAHFQAFKFPDAMSVHFQCTVQVCRFLCPEVRCDETSDYNRLRRQRRDVGEANKTEHTIEIRPRAQVRVLASLDPFNASSSTFDFGAHHQQTPHSERRRLCLSLLRPDTWVLGLPFITATMAVIICLCTICKGQGSSKSI